MVIKTFECPECKKVHEVEMSMNETKANCPDCKCEMNRIYNPCIIRPSADGNGFYGTGN